MSLTGISIKVKIKKGALKKRIILIGSRFKPEAPKKLEMVVNKEK